METIARQISLVSIPGVVNRAMLPANNRATAAESLGGLNLEYFIQFLQIGQPIVLQFPHFLLSSSDEKGNLSMHPERQEGLLED